MSREAIEVDSGMCVLEKLWKDTSGIVPSTGKAWVVEYDTFDRIDRLESELKLAKEQRESWKQSSTRWCEKCDSLEADLAEAREENKELQIALDIAYSCCDPDELREAEKDFKTTGGGLRWNGNR